jgi:prevent-host-death family protein
MRAVNISEAKTHLSRLLEAVESGEQVIISRAGRPIALLTAYDAEASPRVLGGWAGKVVLAEDFDELPDSFLEGFE